MTSLLALISSVALAGTPAYQACCADMGAGACPTELAADGPGSVTQADSGAYRVLGTWKLTCDAGASFDRNATQVLANPPSDGLVLTPLSPSAAACFEAACSLPAALCVVHDGQRAKVVACASGATADANLWSTTAVDDTRAAIVQGHVVEVHTVNGMGATGSGLPTVYQQGQAPVVRRDPAPADTPPVVPTSAVDLSVPDAPPDPCKVNGSLVAASGSQVDAGNEAAMKYDYATALSKYRAAISINQCNPFAWADMGEAFLALKDAARAKQALDVATRLMPTHYQAWTNLGVAEEALGRKKEAAEAYKKALAAHPGYAPADEGLTRTASP